MIGDNEVPVDDDDDNEISDAVEDGDIVVDFDETVGDLSAQINVEKLVAKVESTNADELAEKARIRKRIEEARERKESELDNTYNISLDDD